MAIRGTALPQIMVMGLATHTDAIHAETHLITTAIRLDVIRHSSCKCFTS